ncbi:MAG: hypothetical protein ACRC10_01060 [Thermoguttaceae bacterium]
MMKHILPLLLVLPLFGFFGCCPACSDGTKPAVEKKTDGKELPPPQVSPGTTEPIAANWSTRSVLVADLPVVPQGAENQPIRKIERKVGQVVREDVQAVRKAERQVEKKAGTVLENTKNRVVRPVRKAVSQVLPRGQKGKKVQEQYRPQLFANLPDYLHNPDGMTVSEDQQTIYMCCPNFNGRENNEGPKKNGGFLVSFDLDGNMTKLLEFPVLEETGQTGCMGLDFGPDGNLYVCDNQYFFNKDHKSRILRVIMEEGKPTGEIQVVATGLKLANAILWMNDKLLVTDTFLDLEDRWGAGGIWMFTQEEALNAGKGDVATIPVAPNGTDPRLVVIEQADDIDRHDSAGADGMTCTPDGVVYFGNFGDGAMYRVVFDAENKATVEKIHAGGEVFNCCDGIFYDARTDKIYINDSQKNAIRAFKPVQAGEKPKFELIWENGDTDGSDGLLDQPCECVVIGNKMIICNFDWPFPGLMNSAFDAPYTMSVITLE